MGDERCSLVNRVKTTDSPRRELGTMRNRIKGFPSGLVVLVCLGFFLAAMLAPFSELCWDYKCPVVPGKLYLLLPDIQYWLVKLQ